jgi:hypothetical protein
MSAPTSITKEMEVQREERHDPEKDEKKLWPRDPFREYNEKLGTEIERHLWPGKENQD